MVDFSLENWKLTFPWNQPNGKLTFFFFRLLSLQPNYYLGIVLITRVIIIWSLFLGIWIFHPILPSLKFHAALPLLRIYLIGSLLSRATFYPIHIYLFRVISSFFSSMSNPFFPLSWAIFFIQGVSSFESTSNLFILVVLGHPLALRLLQLFRSSSGDDSLDDS